MAGPSGLAGIAADGTLSGMVAAVGVTGLGFASASVSPPHCWRSSSFELSDELVTPDEGRSVVVRSVPPLALALMPVWLLYTDLDSLLRTALPRAPVFRRLLKRGFRSWIGVVSVLSSGWAQFSVVTVNSMSARTSFPAVVVPRGFCEGVQAEGKSVNPRGLQDRFDSLSTINEKGLLETLAEIKLAAGLGAFRVVAFQFY